MDQAELRRPLREQLDETQQEMARLTMAPVGDGPLPIYTCGK